MKYDWLSDELVNKVKSIFETKYNRELSPGEISDIAENLANLVESIIVVGKLHSESKAGYNDFGTNSLKGGFF